jgi:hypothetical protein
MLPSKNFYDDLTIFPGKNQLIQFCPKTYFFNNISFFFETNIYIYSEIFFPIFFFDRQVFFENFKKDYFVDFDQETKDLEKYKKLNKFFFKKKNLNLFVHKQYEIFKSLFIKILITYFNENIHDCYYLF